MTNKLNIINFIRDVEPRLEMDLLTPVQQQIKIAKRYNLPCTFLFMYDALCDSRFLKLFEGIDDNVELGLWLEMAESHTEKAGIPWRGRYSWDWHVDVGFLSGYTPGERIRLIDTAFDEFKNRFGQYPKSVGSWIIDAFSIKYMTEKYRIDAVCICKEQWGTDGYTLWGGYFNQAYYPSSENMFCPAQSKEYQVSTPCFRMLGIDQIYSYDNDLDENYDKADRQQELSGLEPFLKNSGGNPEWIDWYMKECFQNPSLSFGYTQTGQENSFGWEGTKEGFECQFKKIDEMRKSGIIDVEKLCDTGKWYKSIYKKTPPALYSALTDWKDEGRKSIWYSSAYYRINIFIESKTIWIRDIYLFNEKYSERYLETPCPNNSIIFDNLPVVDGYVWSGNGIRSGIYFNGPDDMEVLDVRLNPLNDKDTKVECMTNRGMICFTLKEKNISIQLPSGEWKVRMLKNNTNETRVEENNGIIYYDHNGIKYRIDINLNANNSIDLQMDSLFIK